MVLIKSQPTTLLPPHGSGLVPMQLLEGQGPLLAEFSDTAEEINLGLSL